jgi:hypothetical protein
MTVRSIGAAVLLTCGLAAGVAMAGDVGGRPFYASLSGAAERPNPGDMDGAGTAKITINPGKSQVCWTLTATGIAPATAAHIHVGGVDDAGGVVVSLSPPTDGSSTGCAEDSDAAAILANPAGYYVNVHNADFPAGAIRGQLSAKKAK